MSRSSSSGFTFVDLFAGIGGFHAVLSGLGGRSVYSVEVDRRAAAVYERNWGVNPLGDITADANDEVMRVPPHDVLAAGFPCQPFSKSGAQKGMEETRGTLYWNILQIVRAHHPSLVVLENVRNLAGPRHRHEWQIIVETLRSEGYKISDAPAIMSPHLLPPERGGRPQVRERVFITATHLGVGVGPAQLEVERPFRNEGVDGWDFRTWDLESDLPLELDHFVEDCDLTETETLWIDAWDEFVRLMWEEREGRRLPGFPLWADAWVTTRELDIPAGSPKWKADFLRKNSEFYTAHQRVIDSWTRRWGVYSTKFPPSRRKLEWQAQDTPTLWDTVMHLRPSGIRAKAATYLPALVAITQTSIVGSRRRRLSPREAARLQGLPDWFDFGSQNAAATYRQLGNAISIGAAWYAIKATAARDEELLKKSAPDLLNSILSAPKSPDKALSR